MQDLLATLVNSRLLRVPALRSRYTTIRVFSQLPSMPSHVFRVEGRDCGTVYAESGVCIRNALAKAGSYSAKHGVASVVLLPRGRYFVNASHTGLAIPPNVTLRGEGHDLTACYFAEDSNVYVHIVEIKILVDVLLTAVDYLLNHGALQHCSKGWLPPRLWRLGFVGPECICDSFSLWRRAGR
jgi:hypothetical protein